MAQYESTIKMMPAPVEKVYAFLSNLENVKNIIEKVKDTPQAIELMKQQGLDPAGLDKLNDVQITADSISAPVPMIGEFAMRIVEREDPSSQAQAQSGTTGSRQGCIKFQTEKSPVDAVLWIQVLTTHEMMTPMGGPGTKMRLTLQADMNPMIKMMIGSKLEKGIEQFADFLAKLPYNQMV